MSKPNKDKNIISFPCSQITPPKFLPHYKELGDSESSKAITGSCNTGHWCSRCEGIWYGSISACECPVCKNRNG